MADIKSPEERSKNMAAIKGKDTGPEVFLRKHLFAAGFRYRINYSSIVGHPDIWLKKYNVAIFVHGCYWHRHAGCRYAYTPKSRVDFWKNKFTEKLNRDKRVQAELYEQGIRCLIVWECTIRNSRKTESELAALMQKIIDFLNSDEMFKEI